MVNSEEYVSDTKRYLEVDEHRLVDNTSLDEDWDFGTQLVPKEED